MSNDYCACPSLSLCQGQGYCARGNVLDPRNPKDIVGQSKPPMHLVPPAAAIEEAKVMGNGAFKYGPYNWRDKDVSHSTYIAAAKRHMDAHWDGQDFDPGAKELHNGKPQPYQLVRNLAAARASLGILIDAILTGHAIDDRPKDGVAGDLLYPSKASP
ncbi:MAG TPA: dATP/dGTP diphosphohydrolase domain-containing protein [Reyranella sp.]|nr:dATP/dGTP diphosphohydrolase domain-containing protein [Reyranella sp.]